MKNFHCGGFLAGMAMCVGRPYGYCEGTLWEVQRTDPAEAVYARLCASLYRLLCGGRPLPKSCFGTDRLRGLWIFGGNFLAGDVQYCGEEHSGRGNGDVCAFGACRRCWMFGRAYRGRYGGGCRRRCAADGASCCYDLSGFDIFWYFPGAEDVKGGCLMIRKIRKNEIPDCVDVICNSFMTVADEFGFTEENAPRFTAFATTKERLIWQWENEERQMFAYFEDGKIVG